MRTCSAALRRCVLNFITSSGAASALGYALLLGLLGVGTMAVVSDVGNSMRDEFCVVAETTRLPDSPIPTCVAHYPQSPLDQALPLDELPVDPVVGVPYQRRIIFDYPGITIVMLGSPPPGLALEGDELVGTPEEPGGDVLEFQAFNDDGELIGTKDLPINVQPNEPPALGDLPENGLGGEAGTPFALTITATDPNLANAEHLAISIPNAPPGFQISPTTPVNNSSNSEQAQAQATITNASPEEGSFLLMVCVTDLTREVCEDIILYFGTGVVGGDPQPDTPRVRIVDDTTPLLVTFNTGAANQPCHEMIAQNLPSAGGNATGVQPGQLFGADGGSFAFCIPDAPSHGICAASTLAPGDRCSFGVMQISAVENPALDAALGEPQGRIRQHAAVASVTFDQGIAYRSVDGDVTEGACEAGSMAFTHNGVDGYQGSVQYFDLAQAGDCPRLTFHAWGGAGGPQSSSQGGAGGYGSGSLLVADAPVTTFSIVVAGGGNRGHGCSNGGGRYAQGGYGGGGDARRWGSGGTTCYSGGGGGLSGIFATTLAEDEGDFQAVDGTRRTEIQATALVIGAGGGGAGMTGNSNDDGGSGGGPSGQSGTGPGHGYGASQSNGGAGGSNRGYSAGTRGSILYGARGGRAGQGGAGGAGYWGGGGGSTGSGDDGGGGGGSGYVSSLLSDAVSVTGASRHTPTTINQNLRLRFAPDPSGEPYPRADVATSVSGRDGGDGLIVIQWSE